HSAVSMVTESHSSMASSMVCRNLFGSVDHALLQEELRNRMEQMMKDDRQRWNFDFLSHTPLPGSFEWEETSAVSFYQEERKRRNQEDGPGTDQEKLSINSNKNQDNLSTVSHKKQENVSITDQENISNKNQENISIIFNKKQENISITSNRNQKNQENVSIFSQNQSETEKKTHLCLIIIFN
uniref:Cyclin-dependent kinase inhibitor domain-containing protein n=1 Tax=Gouania willdenowi TaxID=441366 RepID=A0A8C5D7C0_GOUWI